jgi:hypothetical protein
MTNDLAMPVITQVVGIERTADELARIEAYGVTDHRKIVNLLEVLIVYIRSESLFGGEFRQWPRDLLALVESESECKSGLSKPAYPLRQIVRSEIVSCQDRHARSHRSADEFDLRDPVCEPISAAIRESSQRCEILHRKTKGNRFEPREYRNKSGCAVAKQNVEEGNWRFQRGKLVFRKREKWDQPSSHNARSQQISLPLFTTLSETQDDRGDDCTNGTNRRHYIPKVLLGVDSNGGRVPDDVESEKTKGNEQRGEGQTANRPEATHA